MPNDPNNTLEPDDYIPDPSDADGDDTRIDPDSAKKQGREAGSGTTGSEVSPIPNADMTLDGEEK